jgi:glycosyltransferase involved in cell wall biosynthesis
MIQSLVIYHGDFGKIVGGGEAYMGQLFKFFDGKLNLYLLPAENVRKIDLPAYLKKNYGIRLAHAIRPGSILTKGLFINGQMNMLLSLHKYSLHIVHFPEVEIFRFRRNIYRMFLFFVRRIFYQGAYSYYLCNSKFSADYFKKYFKRVPNDKIKVLFPPVQLFSYNPKLEKKRQIAVCSRIHKPKRIDILIETFNKYFADQDIKLVVIGSVNSRNNEKYLEQLRSIAARGVEFNINPERSRIESIYKESLLFWHAKGYEEPNPAGFEHFGITTVEAMSAGAIPIVINRGGQMEIVDQGINGYKWDTPEELARYTNNVFSLSKKDRLKMAQNAAEKSLVYGIESFKKNFEAVLTDWKELTIKH